MKLCLTLRGFFLVAFLFGTAFAEAATPPATTRAQAIANRTFHPQPERRPMPDQQDSERLGRELAQRLARHCQNS